MSKIRLRKEQSTRILLRRLVMDIYWILDKQLILHRIFFWGDLGWGTVQRGMLLYVS